MYEPSEAALLDDLQTQIAGLITELTGTLLPKLRDLTDTRQRALIVIDPVALQMQDAAVRNELEALAKHLADARDRGVLPADGYTFGRGITAAPVNIVAVSVEAQVHYAATDLIRQLVRDQANRGTCALIRIPSDPPLHVLLNGLREHVWASPNMRLLATVNREIDAVRDLVRGVLDANDRTHMPAPCPYCGERTLVANHRDRIIRCERRPETSCICPDPLCGCKDGPPNFRHEWHASRAKKRGGWLELERLINPDRDPAERLRMHRAIAEDTDTAMYGAKEKA